MQMEILDRDSLEKDYLTFLRNTPSPETLRSLSLKLKRNEDLTQDDLLVIERVFAQLSWYRNVHHQRKKSTSNPHFTPYYRTLIAVLLRERVQAERSGTLLKLKRKKRRPQPDEDKD